MCFIHLKTRCHTFEVFLWDCSHFSFVVVGALYNRSHEHENKNWSYGIKETTWRCKDEINVSSQSETWKIKQTFQISNNKFANKYGKRTTTVDRFETGTRTNQGSWRKGNIGNTKHIEEFQLALKSMELRENKLRQQMEEVNRGHKW